MLIKKRSTCVFVGVGKGIQICVIMNGHDMSLERMW